MNEIAREAAGHGADAPETGRNGNDRDPVGLFRQARNGQAQHRVEQRKGHPGQGSQLPVRQTEIELDRLRQNVDDLAIQEVEHINDQKQTQRITARACGQRFDLVRNGLAVCLTDIRHVAPRVLLH